MAGGIGSPVSEKVAKQIEARRKVIGKTANKTDDDLRYIAGRTGWVRLSSSVNTLTDEEVAQFKNQSGRKNIKGSNQLAGYNILQGGLLNPNRTLRKGMNTYTEVSDTSIADKAAYQNRANSTGIRPMPGITSLSVKSKNTFGTLREAEVKFSVWTLEDFENIERIYLRPGFTMLLEWGHSIYVNNEGELVKSIQTVGNNFFKAGITMKWVLDQISEKRENSDYNYEGMVGYVKNFSWSFNVNGGYDCSVSIISTGEILESLKVSFDPKLRGIPDTEFDDPSDQATQRKSPLHYIFSKITQITNNPFTKISLREKAPTVTQKVDDFKGYFANVHIDDSIIPYQDTPTPMHWITLGTFLDFFNKLVTLLDTTKQDFADQAYVKFNTDTTLSSKYLTSPFHFSIDPTVCVLPKISYDPYTRQTIGVVNNIHTKLNINPSEADNILNILVSVPYLKGKLDEAMDTDGKFNKSAYDIIKSILEGINSSLGGVNDLDLYYDEELNGATYFIIDRDNTTPPSNITPEFKLTGYDSIFTEVSVSSKITNNIGNQISVAAQGTTLNYSDNVENILKWNPNVIDRIRIVKDTSTQPLENKAAIEEDRKIRLSEWKTSVNTFYDAFNNNEEYNKELLETAKTCHAEFTVESINRNRIAKGEPIPGLVPVELSFKLDGIGGFKIGETFKIAPGILPAKYQDKFGYIITGLEHTLGTNNRWETSITTQFYLIEKPSAEEIKNNQPPAPVKAANLQEFLANLAAVANPYTYNPFMQPNPFEAWKQVANNVRTPTTPQE